VPKKEVVLKIKKSIINTSNSGLYVADIPTWQDFLPLLSFLFEASEDMVIVTDCFDHTVYANNKQLQLLGLTAKQFLNQRCSDIFKKNDVMRHYLDDVQTVLFTKKACSVTRIRDVAQSLYDVITITPIINRQEEILGAILIGKLAAIEKPLAEQEVMRRGVYQKTMMDSIPFMIWLKDKDSRLLAANTAYAKMAGVSDPKILEGKTDLDIWPKSLAETYMEDDLKVLSSREPISLAEKIRKIDGGMYWAETYKAPVIVNDEVIGTVGYARDLTEQKQLVSTIIEKDIQFASLLKKLPLSIVRYDKKCRRVFINAIGYDDPKRDALQLLLGSTPMEVWDSNVKNITAEAYQKKLMHVLSHGESQTFEMHCETDGKMLVNMINLLPEFDENQQVVGALAIANDVTEISKYRHDLEHMAFHDTLTSLPNRPFLNQQLHIAAAKGKRFGLIFIDLDFFKTINDTLGHIVGDELLIDASKRILSKVRRDDIVARIGGDEFAILVVDIKNNADLAGLAEKIAEELSAPFTIEGINFFVTASIGIACYPTDSEEVEDLIKYADTAMYEAKKRGRNNYQFYTPELTQDAMEHLAIATALRYAIQKNELSLLFQPKVEISTGKILGAETLLRWQGKVLGHILPDKFIPIAEESGLIVDIGAWVLRASCQAAVQLNQKRLEPLNIAFNVSSKEFVGNHFVENLQRCLQETGCQSNWLTIEITESLLLQHTGKALETLIKLDEMGITLSIDDFGTGYSALAYLSKFPIRQVKIDRSFVMDICSSQSAASLVKAIIAMTLSLDKELVAEGIETDEQAALIKEYGCNQAQGYLYSKPVPFSEFLDLAMQQKIH
jgi:diguanylate cyclase (GGDEF)-like protein/PAS domain S-box-containing protein